MSLKRRVFELLEQQVPGDRLGRSIKLSIGALIVLNVLALIYETHLEPGSATRNYLGMFEVFSVFAFSVEYVLRMWSCTVSEEYRRPILGRLRYALTPLMLIDLVAILPFYIPLVFDVDLRVARILRLLRLQRVLKLGRYSKSLQMLGRILRRKRLDLLSCVFVVSVLLVLAASLTYYAEHKVQPEKFPNITASLWWGVETLSTVGYGDMVPRTPLGKLFGGLVALIGVGLFALPAGIIASGYIEELELRKQPEEDGEQAPSDSREACPHCGRPYP